MLTDVLDTGGLRKKLVHLVADVEFLTRLEVSSCQLLLDTGKHLERSRVLRLSGFVGNTLLCIQDTALKNGRPAVTREVAGLYPMVDVNVRDD